MVPPYGLPHFCEKSANLLKVAIPLLGSRFLCPHHHAVAERDPSRLRFGPSE